MGSMSKATTNAASNTDLALPAAQTDGFASRSGDDHSEIGAADAQLEVVRSRGARAAGPTSPAKEKKAMKRDDEQRLKATSAHLTDGVLRRLDERAAAEGTTRAALIRLAVHRLLNDSGSDGNGAKDTLAVARESVGEVEKGLDRVLVEVIRLGDRIAAMGK